MTHRQARKLRKYVEPQATTYCCVRCHQSDDYVGGWCVRVYDNEFGSVLEVGNPTRLSVRHLVTFAKLGEI